MLKTHGKQLYSLREYEDCVSCFNTHLARVCSNTYAVSVLYFTAELHVFNKAYTTEFIILKILLVYGIR